MGAPAPRVAIVGAGAMGCLFGALLAAAGVDVLLVDVAERLVETIRREGVTVTRDGIATTIPVDATTDPASHSPVSAAIVLVKGYHTASASTLMRPLVGPDTVIASLQNGWGNEAVLADAFGEDRILAGVTYHSATTIAPAVVSHNAPGPLMLGPYSTAAVERCDVLADVLAPSGLDPVVTRDILVEVWKKLVFNAAGLAVGAVTRLGPRGVTANPEVRDLVFDLAREAAYAANAAGYPIDPDERVATLAAALAGTAPGTKGSMQQDVEAGRRTEIDTINGAVVAVAERYGIDAPLNRAMVALIKGIEAAHTPGTTPREPAA